MRDEQMSNGWPFSLLNDNQMSNKVGFEQQPGWLVDVIVSQQGHFSCAMLVFGSVIRGSFFTIMYCHFLERVFVEFPLQKPPPGHFPQQKNTKPIIRIE